VRGKPVGYLLHEKPAEQEGPMARLELDHNGVPDDEAEAFSDGWDEYYLGAMERLLEGE
jgi:hypothetical protein